MTRSHEHREVFPLPPDALFALLHTPSAIRGWWGASRAIVHPRQGGRWAAAWGPEDDPEYVTTATMLAFEPPRRIVFGDYQYYSRSGPLPFEADFRTAFLVEPHAEGATLQVIQEGFPEGPEGDEFYAACDRGWRDTFAGIRRFVETASRAPA